MASDKKPSVYSDRGSFGSAEELDEYGVWIKCEPQDMSLTDSDDLEDAGLSMPDFEESASDISNIKGFDPSALGEIELPDNDFSIESDDNLPSVDALTAEESSDANFDEFPLAGVSIDAVPLVSEDDFEVPTVETIETSSRIKESDFSNQLLQKIANELSSIRNELAEMKKEFAIVRAAVPAGEAKEDDQHGGFFSEEEDETIALTGDELNNILNTADFTEESGANETPDDTLTDTSPIGGSSADEGNAEELIQIDLDSLGIDLNPDIPAEAEAPMEEDKDDELEKLRTEGAIPLNLAPENVSYLEESEIAEFADDASVNSSSFAFNETAIEEPELAAVGIEDDAAESLTDNISGDEIDMDSLDDLAIVDDEVETKESAVGETLDNDFDNMADISIEAQADDAHDIVLPMPEDSFDIDMLTDDSLDISIPEDDFASPPITDDGLPMTEDDFAVLPDADNVIDIDMLTDDSLDISMPEDDFAAPPIADDSLDISMPEDDFAAPPIAYDDLSMPEDDFAGLPTVDDAADGMPIPDDDIVIDTLMDDSLDISIPEDDFASPPIADDGADSLSEPEHSLDTDILTDDSLDISIPEDDFASPPIADDGADSLSEPEYSFDNDILTDDSLDISIPEDNFASLPEPDDFAISPAADDGLPMPDDDFAALTESDDGLDSGLPMPDDDFSMPAEDSGLPTPKDSIENIIPEDFEAGIKDSHVPFEDDLKDELAVQEMSSLLGKTAKGRTEKPVKAPVIRDFPSETAAANKKKSEKSDLDISPTLKNELKTVLSYMDRLLDSLPEEKIAEFAKSEYFDSYKKLFKELGLV